MRVCGVKKLLKQKENMKEFAHIAKKRKSGAMKTIICNEWICPDCGAVETDYYESIIVCDCKKENNYGNLDKAIEKAHEQAKLLCKNGFN